LHVGNRLGQAVAEGGEVELVAVLPVGVHALRVRAAGGPGAELGV
jgi:hypothetical protein